MNSIHTRWQSMAAQQSLRQASAESAAVQSRVSSGLRIAEASHNAAYWSIATTMRSDHKAISAVSDSLNLALGAIDAAMGAQDIVLSSLDGLVNAMLQGVNTPEDITILRKLNDQMEQHLKAMQTAIKSASFGGLNLLMRESGDSTTFSYVNAATRSGSGTFQVMTTDVDRRNFTLIDAATANRGLITKSYADRGGLIAARKLYLEYGPGGAGRTMLLKDSTGEPYPVAYAEAGLDILDQIRQAAQGAFASLGAMHTSISTQLEFTNKHHERLEKGIGRLVDADMNEDSARLKATETRIQLATLALQIANADHRQILQLFQS